MKLIRTVFEDSHSGEAGWESAMVTFAIPDEMFDEIQGKTVLFAGQFVDAVWNDNALPLLSNKIAVDDVIDCWVSSEPGKDELARLPWKHLRFREDITFDAQTWAISDESGNTAPVYMVYDGSF
jgi:hypothetical protein